MTFLKVIISLKWKNIIIDNSKFKKILNVLGGGAQMLAGTIVGALSAVYKNNSKK